MVPECLSMERNREISGFVLNPEDRIKVPQ